MAEYIKKLIATGIHSRFDLEMDFDYGVNIVYGHNGTGKTTLLHILANAVNLDIERFAYLIFEEIRVELDDNTTIRIQRSGESNAKSQITAWLNDIELGTVAPSSLRKKDKDIEQIGAIHQKIRGVRKTKDYSFTATYFPAFRTMIEAWSSVEDEELLRRGIYNTRDFYQARYPPRLFRNRRDERSTMFARRLFGDFVPTLDYPSPLEIEQELNSEIQDAVFKVAKIDQGLLSDAFIQAFSAISHHDDKELGSSPDEILKNIAKLTEQLKETPVQTGKGQEDTVYARLRQQLSSSFQLNPEEQNIAKRLLRIYENSLEKRVSEQTTAFAAIESYVASVNQFLENKDLVIEPNERFGRPVVSVKFTDGRNSDLRTLSSGERQIVGLIYAASHIRSDNVVLVDEPEISLHIDWQESLIESMVNQLPSKQLIVCTHSPVIADYDGRIIETKPTPTKTRLSTAQLQFDLEDLDVDDIPF